MKINNGELKRLTQITEGGEGIIYEYHRDILKVYKKNVDISAKERKVNALIKQPLPKEVVKPNEAVYDSNGRFIGFTMKKVTGEEIKALTNKKHLKANRISTKDILNILVKVQQTIDAIHKTGICIGDLNDQNILFDALGNVYFIDCDSWSIGADKCDVIMDLYKDPFLKGNDFTEETDTYAESILIWKTLTRIHPHGGTMSPDMDILERMRKGISVIDNPKVKIPRTIKPWNNLSPALVSSLKAVFENRSRAIGDELSDMAANLKWCDKDQEYYYGKFNRCPLCDNSASVSVKPLSQGVMSGLTLTAILNGDDIEIVLSDRCYIRKGYAELVEVKSGKWMIYLPGRRYHFLDGVYPDHSDKIIPVSEAADGFEFRTDRDYTVSKKQKTPIYVIGNAIYYISSANTFTKMTVTNRGNGVTALCKCSYDTYFAVEDDHYCILNRFSDGIVANVDGTNIQLQNVPPNIINYGIHHDKATDQWLVVLEHGNGTFRTAIIGKGIDYDTEQIKYVCNPGNLSIYNGAIYIPMDGMIRGYSYKKQTFKDFECSVVTPDSRLIKKTAGAFKIVNDENIYRLGR